MGYVLAKMEDDGEVLHGHITSVAVLRTYRKRGIATRLMRASHRSMISSFGAHFVSLHVRISNKAAHHMYTKTLGYTVDEVCI